MPFTTFLPTGQPSNSSWALSWSLDPADPAPVLYAQMGAQTGDVSATFSKTNVRLTVSKPQSFTSFLTVHPADVRSALDVFSSRWPDLFVPDPRSGADNLWGAAQYADYRGQTDPAKVNTTQLSALGLRLNWDATFPFPFWGQWVGFNGVDTWQDCVAVGHMDVYSGVPAPGQAGLPPAGVPLVPGTGQCETVSLETITGWYNAANSSLGVATLVYANLMEWGYAIEANRTKDIGCDPSNNTAYCIANNLWRGHPLYNGQGFWSAAVGTGDYSGPQDWNVTANGMTWNGNNLTWPIAPGVMTMDPGVEPYRSYILEQVAVQAVRTPSAGLCIDRSDHIRKFNVNGDDGISWAGNSIASWLGSGYASVVRSMGEILHSAGQAVFASSTAPRLDLMGLMDGFYDEFGDLPWCAAVDGLLGLSKPTAAWYASPASLHDSPPVESYLQTCLINGLNPSIPWVLGDHIISGVEPSEPDPLPTYYAYAPLYKLLTHKRWLLTEGAVGLTGPSVGLNISTNAFLVGPTQHDVIVPMLAGIPQLANTTVSVRVNAVPVLPGGVPPNGAWLLYPGANGARQPATPAVQPDGSLDFTITLGATGFAMLQLQY